MRSEELARSVDTLSSSAAEGTLLARDVARGRTKTTFARVHARELGDTVDHEAEKLADATPSQGIGGRKAAAVRLAGEISQTLGDLQVRPDDRSTGRDAAERLDDLGRRATRLSESL